MSDATAQHDNEPSRISKISEVQFNSIDKMLKSHRMRDRIIWQKCLTTIFHRASTVCARPRLDFQMVIDDEYLVNWLDINLKFVACNSSLNGSIKMLHNWSARSHQTSAVFWLWPIPCVCVCGYVLDHYRVNIIYRLILLRTASQNKRRK